MMRLSRFAIAAAMGLALTAMWRAPYILAAPNVIVMMSDDAGYADFGFMNQFTGETTEFKTPNLDAFAQSGKVFSNAYVSAPVCSVSRTGLLTGRYSQRFGFDYNVADVANELDGIPLDQTLLTERFKQLGYSTGTVGKWHIGSDAPKQPQNQGVDEFFGIWGGSRNYFGTAGSDNQLVRRGAATINWNTEPSFNSIPPDPVNGRHLTDAFGDEASKFIANHAGEEQPFFLYVPFTSPHSPYGLAKQQDLAQFSSTSLTGLRKNAAALTYAMDRAVGNILGRVDDPNGDGSMTDSIAGDTIVVFLNDNGGAKPITEAVHDNGPLRDYKGTSWEGGIRTPMIIRGPNVATGVYGEAVSAIDLFPTLVAAAGAPMTTPTDGVNLLPYLSGSQAGPVHDVMFWRGGVGYWAVRKGNWKLVLCWR